MAGDVMSFMSLWRIVHLLIKQIKQFHTTMKKKYESQLRLQRILWEKT